MEGVQVRTTGAFMSTRWCCDLVLFFCSFSFYDEIGSLQKSDDLNLDDQPLSHHEIAADLTFVYCFLSLPPAATKASTTQPSAACGLSRPFCLASLPLDYSSSTTQSAANSIDVHRTNLQNKSITSSASSSSSICKCEKMKEDT